MKAIAVSLALRAFDNDQTIERIFEYEPTCSIIGTGRQQPFCILKQRPCDLKAIAVSLALRAFDNDQTIERIFEYDPTCSIIGTGRQQPFCILKQRPCIPGKTFGGCMGSYPVTADCWLWLHGAWLRETVQGA